MISNEQAQHFAASWIAAWNAHDLDRILSHYDDEVEYFSPFLAKLAGDATGCIRGRDEVRAYLEKGLAAYPRLRFELQQVFTGVTSITLVYRSVNDLLAAEVFELNDAGAVVRVQCHYRQA